MVSDVCMDHYLNVGKVEEKLLDKVIVCWLRQWTRDEKSPLGNSMRHESEEGEETGWAE